MRLFVCLFVCFFFFFFFFFFLFFFVFVVVVVFNYSDIVFINKPYLQEQFSRANRTQIKVANKTTNKGY